MNENIIEEIKKCIAENLNTNDHEVRVDMNLKSKKLSVFCIQKNNRTQEEFKNQDEVVYSISVSPYQIDEFCQCVADQSGYTENDVTVEDDENIYWILKNDPNEFADMYFDEDEERDFETNLYGAQNEDMDGDLI
jgi:hypothetical protein